VFGPDEVPLFEELTSSARADTDSLIPERTRQLLADNTIRHTVEAFFAADLHVSRAAEALSLHPNSLRYRLSRIAELTGRDPRRLTDLLELITASRVIRGHADNGGGASSIRTNHEGSISSTAR
jgi:sugar diacid utilization regulator